MANNYRNDNIRGGKILKDTQIWWSDVASYTLHAGDIHTL